MAKWQIYILSFLAVLTVLVFVVVGLMHFGVVGTNPAENVDINPEESPSVDSNSGSESGEGMENSLGGEGEDVEGLESATEGQSQEVVAPPNPARQAQLSVETGVDGDPLKVSVTCDVEDREGLVNVSIFFGGIEHLASGDPEEVYTQTYTAPGEYTIACIPNYEDEDNEASFTDVASVPYSAEEEVVLGDVEQTSSGDVSI